MSDETKYNILFVCTSNKQSSWGGETGLWLTELVTPYFIFKEAGYTLDICSVKGGAPPCDPESIIDEDGTNENLVTFLTNEKYQNEFNSCKALSQLTDEDLNIYSCIFLCGGHGCIEDFPHNNDITHAIEHIHEKNKGCVASICHGQLGLLDAKIKNGTSKLLNGKMVCAFTNEEEDSLDLLDKVKILTETAVEDAGAICMPSAPWRATAVVDGRLVTAQNPKSCVDVAHRVLDVLRALGSKYSAPENVNKPWGK